VSSYDAFEFDMSKAIQAILAGSRLVLSVGLAVAGVGVGLHFIFPRPYVAEASFLPASSASMSSLMDPLRGVPFGVGAAASLLGGGTSASEIYPELLGSARLLGEALSLPAPTDGSTRGGTYLSVLGFNDLDSLQNLARGVRYVRSKLDVRLNRVNGVVTVSFPDKQARTAAGFVGDLLDCLNRFNMITRQSEAGNVRRFLQQRIGEAKTDLEDAESALSAFKSRNMRIGNAPRLELEESRLQRNLHLAEAIYQTLSQQFELARIDEARDIPTLTIIEPVRLPVVPSGPGLIMKALAGFFIGVLGSMLWLARAGVTGVLRGGPNELGGNPSRA